MAESDPKSPWSEDQIQSTPGGQPDYGPWRITLAAIIILVLLLLAGYFLWRTPVPERTPATPPASASSR